MFSFSLMVTWFAEKGTKGEESSFKEKVKQDGKIHVKQNLS